METWIPWAVKLPATFDPAYVSGKFGYARKYRSLAEIRYVVNHSAEGGIAYLKQGQRPGEPASWMFSNALDGTLYQHFPLECPTWTSGGPIPNVEGVGVEHAGDHIHNPKFTDAQADTDVRLYESLRDLCPNLGAPTHGDGIRIHREVAPGTTSCPNDRDRYDKYDQLNAQPGGDDLTPEQAAQLQALSDWLTEPVGWGRPGESRKAAYDRVLGELASDAQGNLFPLLNQAASKTFTGSLKGD